MSVVNLFIYNLYLTSILVYTKYIHYCAILLDFYFIFLYAINLHYLFMSCQQQEQSTHRYLNMTNN